jgi:geranylgeranyl diphosphate synthase type II
LLSGGKRFRPFLTYLVFKLFSKNIEKIKNLCLALEMIHTYSLIHDDLPCMDNDDLRRGQPTNHKVFSEDISLLAGDGLLTDAFFLISHDQTIKDSTKVSLIKLISEKTGSQGMVSGQAFDMKVQAQMSFEELKKIHTLKTANLIQAAATSAAIVGEASPEETQAIFEFSYHLGMAFQIQDDLLDYADKEQDFKNYIKILGVEKTKVELAQHSEIAKVQLLKVLQNTNNNLLPAIEPLLTLIEFNQKRTT